MRADSLPRTNENLREKTLAYLQLMRAPNLFTAMADVLAGYFIIAKPGIGLLSIVGLLLATSSIYAAGCVLNDLHDRELDARERPFRPLPSGRVSAREARFLLASLFCIGLLAAAPAGWLSFLLACMLCALVVAYDTLTKDMKLIGPLNMGACRSVNLLLGMSPGLVLTGTTLLFPLLTLVYVFSLTNLSRFEVNEGLGSKRWAVGIGWGAVVLMLLIAPAISDAVSRASYVFLFLLILFTGPKLLSALLNPVPGLVIQAVKALVLGIPLLDACYSAAVQGWVPGVIVTFCIVPSVLLARKLYVT